MRGQSAVDLVIVGSFFGFSLFLGIAIRIDAGRARRFGIGLRLAQIRRSPIDQFLPKFDSSIADDTGCRLLCYQ
ncbi:MAG: hypothetical protein B7Z62_03250 [Deltaproteobacteria bacterium 37-65-8]|nr:MAG: hypothetical protein B7Z62_03250 [Deltaproteobacteria bacterium 37-65-8]